MIVVLDPNSIDDYRKFIAIKSLPRFKFTGREAWFPDEYANRVIGETVRNLRKEANLTLKQMARRTGLSVSLLSQIERAESSASISSLYKIAVALDVKIQDLFGNN